MKNDNDRLLKQIDLCHIWGTEI